MAGESFTVKAEAEAAFLEHTVDQQRAIEAELRLVHARFQCSIAGGISAFPCWPGEGIERQWRRPARAGIDQHQRTLEVLGTIIDLHQQVVLVEIGFLLLKRIFDGCPMPRIAEVHRAVAVAAAVVVVGQIHARVADASPAAHIVPRLRRAAQQP
ncbi:hypothetical protein D3C75_995700 [compost metagenome]